MTNLKQLISSLWLLLGYDPRQGMISPVPDYPIPTQPVDNYIQNIQQGLTRWGKGTAPPIATMSAQLAQAGANLPHKYLPAAVALKETGGLRDSAKARQLNNPYGMGPNISYPTLEQSIVGGGGKRGFKGVLEGPLYEKYRQSGDLKDFINVYSPPSVHNNPSMNDQIATLSSLLSLFEK